MHNLLTSIVLCFFAHAASAQCLNTTTAAPVNASARPGVELITTAAAETRDGPVMRQTSAVARDGALMRQTAAGTPTKAPSNDGEEHRHPTGAMLLAALALMSGIALRRAGASGR